MPSMFKKNNRKTLKPASNSLIRSTSGMSYGDDVDDVVTPPGGRAPKLHKTSRSSTTIMSISSTSMSSISSASDFFPLDHRPVNDIADLLQPQHYTALLLQASANREPSILTSTDPGMGLHSKETSLDVPPSTPIDSIRMDTPPVIFVSEADSVADALIEGVTYDAILTSTLHKNLGMSGGMNYLDIPATRTPPNSPVVIQEGGFGSLIGVSMAIMEGGL